MSAKKAYLYSRVSSEQQLKGDGIERQQEAGITFIQQKGYILEETIIDDGVSAFTGSNIDKGNLGRFIKRIENGEIEKGSVLVLEAIDRLSRLPLEESQEIMKRITNHHVDIGLVRFGIVIDASEKNNIMAAMICSVGMWLAHEESKQKSERLKATWERKFSSGERVKREPPFWLDWDYNPIPTQVEIVKQIFELRLQGYGVAVIGEKVGFGKKKIIRLLRNLSVTGIHPRSDLKDYFPKIIEQDVFEIVQSSFEKMPFGRTGDYHNWLRGLSKCPICHHATVGSMCKPYFYLKCGNKIQNKSNCTYKQVNLWAVQDKILAFFKGIDFRLIKRTEQVDALAIEAELSRLDSLIQGNVETMASLIGTAKEALVTAIKRQSSAREELASQLNRERLKIRSNDVIEGDLATPEGRQLINNTLKQFVEYVRVDKTSFTVKFLDVNFELNIPYEAEISGSFFNSLNNMKWGHSSKVINVNLDGTYNIPDSVEEDFNFEPVEN